METQDRYQSEFITGSPMPSEQEKQWAMLAHLLTLAPYVFGAPFIAIAAPLIIRATKGETSLWVDNHAKESLNFQLTLLIGYGVALITMPCFFLGLFIGGGVALFGLVFALIAGIKANNGEVYRYPVSLRLVK